MGVIFYNTFYWIMKGCLGSPHPLNKQLASYVSTIYQGIKSCNDQRINMALHPAAKTLVWVGHVLPRIWEVTKIFHLGMVGGEKSRGKQTLCESL